MKLSRKQVMHNLGRIQVLVGRARSAYDNDRAQNRGELIVDALKEAFDLCMTTQD